MEPGARSALIRDVFREYVAARRELLAALERCAVKGWPDRVEAIRLAMRLQELLCYQELERLNYVIASATDGLLNSYTRVGRIREQLNDAWSRSDEEAPIAGNPAYAAIRNEIERSRPLLDSGGLEGPFEMARRDPEMIGAGNSFARSIYALDAKLSQSAQG